MSFDDDDDLDLDDDGMGSEPDEDDDFADLFTEDPDARKVDDLDDDGDWS